jgi:phosphatidylglycerophosphatase A
VITPMRIARLPEGRRLSEPMTAIATFGGVGLLPLAPGSWGALAAMPLGWLLAMAGGWVALLIGAAVASVIGWVAAERYVKATGREDPPEIVIDEVAAQWLALSVVPVTLTAYVVAYLVFRVFDTLKPWPASWADREVDGGAGVMLDDLFAGGYSAIVLFALNIMGLI